MMWGGLGLGAASCGDSEAMIGKCLDSKGREVMDWKLTMRFCVERGEMKSSSLEY